ncbi:MAG: hypothetical protein AMJ60_10210 [Desulfobacterales bacterium SG8_35]|nr:MAG: hypothetical protein AMJ60_10210 [Desulfobacterales bacterium SG8_35]
MTDVEPISSEIIHDFSGSFTVENRNVTGTVNLDHTPVGGLRNAHDINYDGLFLNKNELDMDWEVPGADTGIENWTRVPYTGITEQAEITEENASILAVNTWISGATGSAVGIVGSVTETKATVDVNMTDMLFLFEAVILKIGPFSGENRPIVGAVETINETENGSCGGSLHIVGTVDDQTGEVKGTVTFNDYCEEGIILDGSADIMGHLDLISEEFFHYLFTYKNMMATVLDQSVVINGRTAGDFTVSPTRIMLSYVVEDIITAKSYWLKDLIAGIVESLNYYEINELSGRYYDPDYGYVEVSVGDPIHVNEDDFWPSSGSMILLGAQNTKARLTFVSATEFLIEADTDGDGLYDDYSSGIQLWSEL